MKNIAIATPFQWGKRQEVLNLPLFGEILRLRLHSDFIQEVTPPPNQEEFPQKGFIQIGRCSPNQVRDFSLLVCSSSP